MLARPADNRLSPCHRGWFNVDSRAPLSSQFSALRTCLCPEEARVAMTHTAASPAHVATDTQTDVIMTCTSPGAPVCQSIYYLERCTILNKHSFMRRRRSESQLLAHSWCLHVNPVECFVYGLLHMARGGAAGGCKYYSWTLLSLKTDSVFLSLFPPFLPPHSSRN